MKLSHWNAGNAWWENKQTEITALTQEWDPDLLFISEANLRETITQEERHIQGYYIIVPNTSVNIGYSRIILLVKEGVKISIMDECMDMNIPAIWVKIIACGRKPIVIGGLYREHHLLLQPQPNLTDDRNLQIVRWKKSINGWLKAAKNTKCILIGDLNLDYTRWANPDFRTKKMVQDTKDQIETQGFCQMIKNVTRSWPGQPSSLVDHLWTNSPGSIISTMNVVRAASDHNHISATIRTKDRTEYAHEITIRDRKNMSLNEYRDKLKSLDWTEFYSSEDINKLNDIFVTKVGGILNILAPLKNHQMRSNHKNWINPEIKTEMEARHASRELARRSGSAAHWAAYRKRRNLCSKNLLKLKK